MNASLRRAAAPDETDCLDWGRLVLGGLGIGDKGENLTVLVSSTGEAAAHRLVASLRAAAPEFGGSIVIYSPDGPIDRETLVSAPPGQSEPEFALILRKGDLGQPHVFNAAVSETEHRWILALDDTITFANGFLDSFRDAVGASRASFLSVAVADEPDAPPTVACRLLACFDRGAVAFRLAGGRAVGPAHASAQTARLGHALWRGPIAFRTATFRHVGGFDPALHGGVERLDLSLRLHEARIPVEPAVARGLVRAAGGLSDYASDFAGLLEGSSPETCRQARYIEAKHRVSLTRLDPEYHSELARQYTSVFTRSRHRGQQAGRPRIAFIIDFDNWAFANITRQVLKHSSDIFDYTVIPSSTIQNPVHMMLMTQQADLVHFFFRGYIDWLCSPYMDGYAASIGMTADLFRKRFVHNRKITTSIYDHLFLEPDEVPRMRMLLNEIVTDYYVSSNKLDAIYRSLPGFPAPGAVLPDGVDLEHFRPSRLERFRDAADRELVVGWVGNSQWASHMEDPKGVHTILLPAIDEAKSRGASLRPHFADRQVRHIPHADMPAYYGEIDVLVCASKIEGTPNPVLEAMACGVPVISTDVGIVPDALGPLQKQFILPERTVGDMAATLTFLSENRSMLPKLSEENLASVKAWDWSIRVKGFEPFFRNVLQAKARLQDNRRAVPERA